MQQPPIQPVAEPGPVPANGRGGGRTRALAIGGTALVAIVLATFLVLQFAGGSSVEVTLRSLGSSGDDPFTDSVAPAPSGNLADFAERGFPDGAAVDLATASSQGGGAAGNLSQYRTVSATVPGVFGGSLDETTCDKDQLVTFLTSEPDKAVAWASVLGMDVDDITAYVEELTGVNLGSDTRVLDHGFSDGKLVARQAVLQRGTAVLVDARGVPRVDCYTGNPLRQPTVSEDETFIGTPWTSFDEAEVVVIADAPEPIESFEVVSVDDGTSFVRPVGSTGQADVPDPAAAASSETAAEPDDEEPAATSVPTTPTPPSATRELVYGGTLELNDPISTEVGSEEPELIYTFDAPPGAKLEIQVANDRASVSGVGVDFRSAGDRITFFRVPPGGTDSFPLSLGSEDGGEYELVITEGPAAFDLVVAAEGQDDAGQGGDAGPDFDTAFEISSGQLVAGHLAGFDSIDSYVIDLGEAPTLVITAAVERGSDSGAAFDLQLLGDRLHFFRVNPAADDSFELRFGVEDELLELFVTEGPAEYEFTVELVPQRDGGQDGDAGTDLADARSLGSVDSFTGQVGDRDGADYYTFEAPADEFTVTVDVTAQSPRAVGVDVQGPDGNRIEFFRVQPGATGSADVVVDGGEGETFRLVMTEGRGDYEVTIE